MDEIEQEAIRLVKRIIHLRSQADRKAQQVVAMEREIEAGIAKGDHVRLATRRKLENSAVAVRELDRESSEMVGSLLDLLNGI